MDSVLTKYKVYSIVIDMVKIIDDIIDSCGVKFMNTYLCNKYTWSCQKKKPLHAKALCLIRTQCHAIRGSVTGFDMLEIMY